MKKYLLLTLLLCSTGLAYAQQVRNVVLVHGAFVDASSWRPVANILMRKGFHVTAVQNPLTSLSDDVEAVRRVLEQQKGDTILVGYSWGGMPITQIGNDEKVKGLVYIAAMAPKVGESITDLQKQEPEQATMRGLEGVIEDGYGNYLIDPDWYHYALAHDSDPELVKWFAYSQIPMSKAAFDERVTHAAWVDKPSWYAISGDDKIVSPKLQQMMAKRMKAETVTIDSGHASILSHPYEVAELIEQASRYSYK